MRASYGLCCWRTCDGCRTPLRGRLERAADVRFLDQDMIRRSRNSGFTMVEMLVAIALSLFLMTGVIQVFIGAKQSYRTSQALARVQEAVRFALELISRDLRGAGFSAGVEFCGGAPGYELETLPGEGLLQPGRLRIALDCYSGGALDGSKPGCENLDPISDLGTVRDPLLGYEANPQKWAPVLPEAIADLAVSPVAGTDVVSIRRDRVSEGVEPIPVLAHHGGALPGSASIKIDADDIDCANPDAVCIEPGDVLLVTDEFCENAAMFQVSAGNPDISGTIDHNTGNAQGAPGNRTNTLGKDFTNGFLHPNHLDPGTTVTYYIALDSGRRALFRSLDGAAGESMVGGVEDMQLLYGEDTDGDGSVDLYRAADQVADWDAVRAARISLLVQSPEDNVTVEPQVIAWNGNNAYNAGGDRRLRQVFTSTVSTRNLL